MDTEPEEVSPTWRCPCSKSDGDDRVGSETGSDSDEEAQACVVKHAYDKTEGTTAAGFCRCVPLVFSHRGEPHHADQPVAVTSHGNLHAGPSGGLEPNATKNDDPCCPKGCAYSRTTSTMTSNAAAHNHSHERPKTMK